MLDPVLRYVVEFLPGIAAVITAGILLWTQRGRLPARARGLAVAGLAAVILAMLVELATSVLLAATLTVFGGSGHTFEVAVLALVVTSDVLHWTGFGLVVGAVVAGRNRISQKAESPWTVPDLPAMDAPAAQTDASGW